MKIYAIKNCDTVKKTLSLLDAKAVKYEFHDYKRLGIDAAKIEEWLKQVDLETLINKKGTTYKMLSDEQKAALENKETAIQIMIEKTSVIKRPILERNNKIFVGMEKILEATIA